MRETETERERESKQEIARKFEGDRGGEREGKGGDR